jgi:predicted transcriptional regulator
MSAMVNKSNINVDGLIRYAETKKKQTMEKVDLAIRKIVINKGNINFNSVSQTAGVSKAYLYKNTQIRERIEGLRSQNNNAYKYSKKEMTESSKDIVIVAKNKKIDELEKENKYLKEQLMTLRGKVYDSI